MVEDARMQSADERTVNGFALLLTIELVVCTRVAGSVLVASGAVADAGHLGRARRFGRLLLDCARLERRGARAVRPVWSTGVVGDALGVRPGMMGRGLGACVRCAPDRDGCRDRGNGDRLWVDHAAPFVVGQTTRS
ncbi:MAG: hypothetical protein ACR2KV_15245 [Solirubrobacteraceae bacterium]